MKIEKFEILSVLVNIVLRVIRVGMKTLNEELAEEPTMKLKIKYYSSDNNTLVF